MSDPKDSVYLRHIRDALAEIRAIIGEQDAGALQKNRAAYYGILYLLVVIGEASHGLSDALKAARPDIPWSQVKGMRNVLIHEYTGVSFEVVWKTL